MRNQQATLAYEAVQGELARPACPQAGRAPPKVPAGRLCDRLAEDQPPAARGQRSLDSGLLPGVVSNLMGRP